MITIALGFATALVYGFADFFGAIASKKIAPVIVTCLSGATGLLFLFALTPIFGATANPEAIGLGIWAGVWSAFAMTCLYASLAIGPISILSPLGAVVSAIVPAMVGFAQGDRFSWLGWVAIAFILIAVVLVGFVPGEDVRLPSAKGFLLALGAGLGIGAVLICLDAAPQDSGLTPVILLRAVSATLLGVYFIGSLILGRVKPSPRVSRKLWFALLGAGLLDSSANVFFLMASRVGSLTVVSVLTALYPLGTIILARVFLKEKIARVQTVGVLLALTASSLLAIA
jgi:drug/metabolite transporter (DMT)-like permease